VDRARADGDVQARARASVGQRLHRCVEVGRATARERGDGGGLDCRADRTPSKSPCDDAGKPASITSTPSRSSACAISTLSSGDSAMPGDCSPSLSVVSKIVILRLVATSLLLLRAAHEGVPVVCFGRRLRPIGA
jgi:hypothetical protein